MYIQKYCQICTSNTYLKRKVKMSILIKQFTSLMTSMKHVESKLFNQNGHFYFSFHIYIYIYIERERERERVEF